MPQKTMMWKGVALVEAPTIGRETHCSGCYFKPEGVGICQGIGHLVEAAVFFGGMCGQRDVIYVPARPTESDAEWVEAKMQEVIAATPLPIWPDKFLRAALLAAIKRGRGE